MSEVRIANLTPHTLDIKTKYGIIKIKPSGFVLRVSEEIVDLGEKNGIKIIQKRFRNIPYEDIEELKKYLRDYDMIVVSALCRDSLIELYNKGILDLDEVCKLYTIGEVKRDESGKVLYAESLSTLL